MRYFFVLNRKYFNKIDEYVFVGDELTQSNLKRLVPYHLKDDCGMNDNDTKTVYTDVDEYKLVPRSYKIYVWEGRKRNEGLKNAKIVSFDEAYELATQDESKSKTTKQRPHPKNNCYLHCISGAKEELTEKALLNEVNREYGLNLSYRKGTKYKDPFTYEGYRKKNGRTWKNYRNSQYKNVSNL